jgi:predicted component of type VI protein secretion system
VTASRTAPRPRWHERVRGLLPGPGRYLAYLDDEGEIQILPLKSGWSRIGRSAAADIRLDDPSVSRRHALVVSEDGEALHVLDDRSLNGVLVNDEVVEWGCLEDGDELIVGRFRLLVLEG